MSVPIPLISPNKGKNKASHHLASGALSGFSSAICLQPLDLLKTRLQQGGSGQDVKRRRIGTVAREVLRDDGIFGLWRGTVPTVVRNVPGVALYFYTLSSLRTHLSTVPYFAGSIPFQTTPPPIHLPTSPSSSRSSSSTLVKLNSQGNLIAGAIARTWVGFLLNPVTVIKARYESSQYTQYRSLLQAFRSLIAEHGVRGLFQGVVATAARDAPYAGLSVVFYEESKDIAGRLIPPESGIPNALIHSGSGVVAAIFATLATSPADCVKTRMQVNPSEHPTIRLAIRRIYTDRGLRGFFSGTTLRISRKAASGAIAWTVYEGLLLFLRDRDGRETAGIV